MKHVNSRTTRSFRLDPSRRHHYIHRVDLGNACQRFEGFQTILLESGLQHLDGSTLVLGCLLAYDAVCTDLDLRSAYSACTNVIRWCDAVRVDWLDGTRINARHLCAMTIIAIHNVQGWDSFEQAQAKLLQFLDNNPLLSSSPDRTSLTWDDLLSDGLAWCQATLPPMLFGHVNQTSSLSALPRSALAREASRLALSSEPIESSVASTTTDTVYARAFEAAMLGKPAGMLTGGQFIRRLIQALRPPATGSKSTKRSAILDQLHVLAAEIDQVDEICALLYLHAVNLVESGTRSKSELAPTTPYDYIQSFAADFHAGASVLRLGDIAPEAYAGIFRNLLNGPQKINSYRAAGLKAFHLFLRAWWQAPALPGDVFRLDNDASVAANMVWPHELDRINEWLIKMEPNRFASQLHCAFSIASSSMIRIGELRALRLKNVLDEGEHLTIELAREIRDGTEKTTEGRRRVFIHDQRAAKQIQNWYARRLEEKASSSDYLFGDPSDPSKLADSGKMYYWLNRLLKCASGDDSISLHSLRHSIASLRLDAILMSDVEGEINPADTLANEAGHVGAHVTAVNYGHVFEAGLRRALDSGLLHLFHDYRVTSIWTGLGAEALRQRVHRAKSTATRSTILASALETSAVKLQFPDSSAGFALEEPVNPLANLRPKPLRLNQILGILGDVAQGLSFQQVRLRQDIDEELVRRAIELAGEFANTHGDPEMDMPDLLTLGVRSLRDNTGKLLGLTPDFARTSQSRWELLARAIDRMDSEVLSGATLYWRRALVGTHLAVRPGTSLDSFINLLGQSGINSSLIALKISSPGASDGKVDEAVALAQATIRLHFGRSVRQIAQSYRPGRPPIWLVIGSDPNTLTTDGSANSMAGLHCCMLATHVWTSLKSEHY